MKKAKPRKTSSDKRVSNSRKKKEKTKHGRVTFDRRVRIEAKGAQITTDAGLLIMRELADAIGLTDMAQATLRDTRPGKNKVHSFEAMLLQSVFSRVAGYEDVNDADTLAHDPAMRLAVGGRAVDTQAASSSQMSRFERETLATPENLKALSDLNGKIIDQIIDRKGTGEVVIDMDSSSSKVHGKQEESKYNGYFKFKCYHPLFAFNQDGMLEHCSLRPGNDHSANNWKDDLDPIFDRYSKRGITPAFRGDAAFAKPELYTYLEEANSEYAIRLPTNKVLQAKIDKHQARPENGEASLDEIQRIYVEFQYKAESWEKERRVVAKIEWPPGELIPKIGFIVTNMKKKPEDVVEFYNKRGTAEQYIKEGKLTFNWTRLSCKRFCDNQARLQLHALAYNLTAALHRIELPEKMKKWSLGTLQLKLIKIGARLVRHARAFTFQLAEVAVTGSMINSILEAIDSLRPPPQRA